MRTIEQPMRLRFPLSHIERHALAYTYPRQEIDLIALRGQVQEAEHLTKQQLLLLAKWKSPRSADRVQGNTDLYVQEVTSFALNCQDERARVEALTLLDGVLWPTASVILHLFHTQPYLILDYRALWSVSTEVPSQYTYPFWETYVDYCRSLARQGKVSMRTVDRALWQYSKDNQPQGVA